MIVIFIFGLLKEEDNVVVDNVVVDKVGELNVNLLDGKHNPNNPGKI